jgi:hypothetical protein
MVRDINSCGFTRGYGPVYYLLEIFPAVVSKDFLQIPGIPKFHSRFWPYIGNTVKLLMQPNYQFFFHRETSNPCEILFLFAFQPNQLRAKTSFSSFWQTLGCLLKMSDGFFPSATVVKNFFTTES